MSRTSNKTAANKVSNANTNTTTNNTNAADVQPINEPINEPADVQPADVQPINEPINEPADVQPADVQPADVQPAARVELSAADVIITAAELIKSCGTLAAIKSQYKELTDKYGKTTYKAILSAAATIRVSEIDAAAKSVKAAVTYDGQLLAAYNDARTAADWPRLCQYVNTPSQPASDTKADKIAAAKAFVASYFNDVDADGWPLVVSWYVSASGKTAYKTYTRRDLKATNAAALFLSAVDGARKAANNAATRATDTADKEHKHAAVRVVGKVYDAAAVSARLTDNGGIVFTRTYDADENGRKVAANVVAKRYDGKVVCNADGQPATNANGVALFTRYADWRKAEIERLTASRDAKANADAKAE